MGATCLHLDSMFVVMDVSDEWEGWWVCCVGSAQVVVIVTEGGRRVLRILRAWGKEAVPESGINSLDALLLSAREQGRKDGVV